MTQEDLVYRLLKRAEIRRSISTRKSVQEGKPDRISDLLEEAAKRIQELEEINKERIMITVIEQWEKFILDNEGEFLEKFLPEGAIASKYELIDVKFGSYWSKFWFMDTSGEILTYSFEMKDFLDWYHRKSITNFINTLENRGKDA